MARILDEVVGHQEPLRRLLSAHKKDRLAQTLIFAGPSGVGKKKVALGLSQQLICETGTGCGRCGPCQRVEKQQSESLLLIQPEGQQIKMEQARRIRQFVALQGLARARVVIVDEAQTMNVTAANSLLKTIEEPPPRSYFIFLVRSLSSLLPTICSRAQVLNFAGLRREELNALGPFESWVLEASSGSVEQAKSFSGEGWAELRSQAFDRLARALKGEPWKSAEGIKEMLKEREGALFVAQTYQKWLRDVLRAQMGNREWINPDHGELIELGARFSHEKIQELCENQKQMEKDILGHVDRTLVFENFFLGLSQDRSVTEPTMNRIRK